MFPPSLYSQPKLRIKFATNIDKRPYIILYLILLYPPLLPQHAQQASNSPVETVNALFLLF